MGPGMQSSIQPIENSLFPAKIIISKQQNFSFLTFRIALKLDVNIALFGPQIAVQTMQFLCIRKLEKKVTYVLHASVTLNNTTLFFFICLNGLWSFPILL